MQKHRRRNWLIRCLGVGLVVLAVGAPVAQARVDGSTGWSGARSEQALSGAAAQEALRSNWLGVVQPSTTAQDVLRSNWLGIAQPRVASDTSPAPTQIVGRSDGFDWGDAGIGAGTALAVMLLAAGGITGSRRVRHQATA
jgi:hypothetical protein